MTRISPSTRSNRSCQDVEARAGRGIGAIEAPRGTLFHEYELDDDGRVIAANVVTPTAQNLANVERDLRHAATSCSGRAVSPTPS